MKYIFMLCLALAFSVNSLNASDVAHDENEVDVGHMLFGHIGDSYGWHITDWNGQHISIPLPCIVKSKDGWQAFMSSKIEHGHEYKGLFIAEEGRYEGKIVERGEDGKLIRPFDISITKNVCSLMITALILVLIVLGAARWYRKNDAADAAPGGFTGLMEMLIMMVNDEIIKPSLEMHPVFFTQKRKAAVAEGTSEANDNKTTKTESADQGDDKNGTDN